MPEGAGSPVHPDEAATMNAFIIKEKKQRYLDMLPQPKKRAKLLDGLNHCRDIDERFATSVEWHQALEELRKRGAPVLCHVMSSIGELDGATLPLVAALEMIERGGWGTIVSCLPGNLAYYYDECGYRRLILERPMS